MTILNTDLYFSHLVQNLKLPFLTEYLFFVSWIGNFVPMFVILSICLFYFYFTKHQKAAIYLFLSTSFGVGLSTILKIYFARPRPTQNLVNVLIHLKDFSFPSSHCVSFTILFGFLYFYLTIHQKHNPYNLLTRAILLLLIVSVGFSRIYLGAHWLTDCLGGYLLGYIILFITIKIFKK